MLLYFYIDYLYFRKALFYEKSSFKGLNTIIAKDDNNEYSIGTYNGDVQIVIEEDMVHYFEYALKNKLITGNDIIEQAKRDE